MIELNPLDVLHSRKLFRIPRHFSKVKLSDSSFVTDLHEIENWIENRCKSRYSISKVCSTDNTGKIKESTFAGFEEEKELTYFMLACPYFRR
jgi:hypothetical protein